MRCTASGQHRKPVEKHYRSLEIRKGIKEQKYCVVKFSPSIGKESKVLIQFCTASSTRPSSRLRYIKKMLWCQRRVGILDNTNNAIALVEQITPKIFTRTDKYDSCMLDQGKASSSAFL